MSDTIAYVVVPHSSVWGDEDDRWSEAVQRLWRELEGELGRPAIVRHQDAQPGTKGSLQTVVMAIGTPGAFASGALVLREWLLKAGDRRVTIRRADRPAGDAVTLSSASVHDGSFAAMLRALAPPDPAGAT